MDADRLITSEPTMDQGSRAQVCVGEDLPGMHACSTIPVRPDSRPML